MFILTSQMDVAGNLLFLYDYTVVASGVKMFKLSLLYFFIL